MILRLVSFPDLRFVSCHRCLAQDLASDHPERSIVEDPIDVSCWLCANVVVQPNFGVMSVFGVGTDIAFIPRFTRILRLHQDRFLRRALHPLEVCAFLAIPNSEHTQRLRFLASRLVPFWLFRLLGCLFKV